eukprot:656405_1
MPPKISKGIEIHTTITCDNHVIIIVLHSQCHIFSILQNTSTHTPTPAPTDQNDSATAHIPTSYTEPFTTNRAETFYPTAASPYPTTSAPNPKPTPYLTTSASTPPAPTTMTSAYPITPTVASTGTLQLQRVISHTKVTMTTAAIWIEPSADYRVSITPKHR